MFVPETWMAVDAISACIMIVLAVASIGTTQWVRATAAGTVERTSGGMSSKSVAITAVAQSRRVGGVLSGTLAFPRSGT